MFTSQQLDDRLQGTLPDLLGIHFVDAVPERVRATLLVRPDLCTLGHVAHGGALMAFADTLGAVATVLNLAPDQRTTTLESKTNFMRSAPEGTTLAGECLPPMPRAIQISHYGPPSVLELVHVHLPPVPPGEIRFRVIAAAVNRADVEIRSGQWPITGAGPNPFPYTPGLEALGDVVEIGAGVVGLALGQRVITMMQKLGGIWGLRPGGYQEFVTVGAGKVAVVPPDLDPFDVAALGLTAVTASNGLRRLGLRPGERLVVTGGSGGLGSNAIAMARALGVEVIATSSGAGKDGYLRALGATAIVHLDTTGLLDALGPRSVDAVLETLGERTFHDSVAVLRRGGRLCLLGALTGENLRLSAWDLLQDLRLTGYSSENLTGDDLRADMAHITALLRAGQLAPPAYQKFPLAQAAEVHALMERNALAGRALLVP